VRDGGRPVTALHEALVDALAAVADQLPEAPPGTKLDPGDRLDVRGNRHVGRCPAATALDGDTPFEASAATVAWELAAHAGDRLLHGSADPSRARVPTSPADALAVAVEEVSDNWAFDWWAEQDEAARSVAEGGVLRRLTGVARLATAWPPPSPVTYGHRPTWMFPRRPLRLVGRADLVVGRRGHDHTLVVGLGGDHGPDTRRRLAFEAVVESAALRRPPAKVVGLLPDAGRRWTLTVDDDLLAEGVTVAADAARVALGTRRRDAAGLERNAGPACRTCAHGAGCPAGEAWLAGPGRLRAGFLPPG
jgi:hypothetical protein